MNESDFRRIFPFAKVENYTDTWDDLCRYASLHSPEQKALFLANVGHENGGFTRFEENLNYSADGLAKTWPERYARNPESKVKVPNQTAKTIAMEPQDIANLTYAKRNGNGNVASGDGWRFRGRGDIMTTFHDNYLALDTEFNMNGKIMANPDILLQPYWSRMSSGFFWKRNKIYQVKGIENVRKAVNGGLIGLDEVKKLYERLIEVV